ncbi:hypothetical protein GUJ93_ZPchr0010g10107 [Zizania palustris]|uniref:Uncharacterized protein n=1 Tax=Zizania palustris TaxID=103762 RepID=A0A8J5W6B1_ZIZPA|nr:hypothetical protein GUJ93_ZPchr0010g10107 [Zizania palustris]
MNSPDGIRSGGGVEETLKGIMKRLDAIEERLLPIQSLEERLTAPEISVRSPLGRQEFLAASVPAHTPEQGQDGGRKDFPPSRPRRGGGLEGSPASQPGKQAPRSRQRRGR